MNIRKSSNTIYQDNLYSAWTWATGLPRPHPSPAFLPPTNNKSWIPWAKGLVYLKFFFPLDYTSPKQVGVGVGQLEALNVGLGGS